MGQEAEQAVEPENKGHQGSDIFPDHFKFLIPLVVIVDPHIVQGLKGRQKQGDKNCNPGYQKKSPRLKPDRNIEESGTGGRFGDGLDKGQ